MKKFLSALVLALALAVAPAFGQLVPGQSYTLTNITLNDGAFFVPPGACAWTTSGTSTGTNGLTIAGASDTPVNQVQVSNAGASNNTLTCALTLPQRLLSGKGVTVTDVTVFYGIQTTALTSLGAPTISTITFPAAGTSETASTVTPVSAGAVTVTPVVGSANLGTTTAGAFFSEKVALNTAVNFSTDLQEILFQQVFAQSASAADIVNTPGLLVHYNINVF